MVNKKLICFDVDGTLTETKSLWLALMQGLGCPVDKVVGFFNAAMAGKISFSEGEKGVADLFRASGKATKEFIESVFDKEILKSEATDIIEYLRGNGYDIWLISGAIDVYVRLVAKKIGAAGFFAHSSFEFDEMGILSKINYSGDQNPWKAKMVRKLAQNYGILLEDIIFVGDGQNDIDAFKLTGRGIAVYPYDEKLGAVAWKTIKSLSEIKDILQ
jgi:HAD superfamily phosphoserine phosphatase-like hydrolase